jgi:hypothetical protein
MSQIDHATHISGRTVLTRGARERLGFVLLALGCLWLAIAAVLGWIG